MIGASNNNCYSTKCYITSSDFLNESWEKKNLFLCATYNLKLMNEDNNNKIAESEEAISKYYDLPIIELWTVQRMKNKTYFIMISVFTRATIITV